MKKAFKYIEPLWLGKNNKISIRSTLAIAFSWNFMWNLSYAIKKWSDGRSMSDLAVILGIEAGLIAGLLALRTYQNMQFENRRTGVDQDKCDPATLGSSGGKIGTE
jgi:hypothetical protein